MNEKNDPHAEWVHFGGGVEFLSDHFILGTMHKLRNLLGGVPPYRNDYVTFWGGGGTPPNVTLNKTQPKKITVVVTGGRGVPPHVT